MAELIFTISNAARDELKEVAKEAGFTTLLGAGNIKAMTKANWRNSIAARRQKAIDDARPSVDMSDVDLGTDE